MGIEKRACSFRLDGDIIEQLEVYAKQENRSLSNFVETVLINHLEQKETKASQMKSLDRLVKNADEKETTGK